MSEPAAASADPSPPDSPARAVEAVAPPTALTLPRPRHMMLRAMRLGWVPLVAATLSLVLSLTSIYVATRQPDVLLIMPDLVRLAGGHATGHSYAYLQPAFVSTGNNDRVEVIRDMTLTIRPATGGASAVMTWTGLTNLVGTGGTLTYQYAGDAVPLLVGPRTASAPWAVFDAPAGWFLEAGTYELTLRAERVMASEPLQGTFSVTITPEQIDVLDAIPERFLGFPIG